MSFKYTEIGKIPVEWDVKMIQEIGEVVSGGTPKTKEDSYWDGNISWITPKDLSSFTERYIEVGERSITELGLKNSSAKLLPKGTVLFSSRAPIGYLAIARKELCTNQGFKNIVCDKKYSSNEFLFYMLKAKKNEIESIAGGSTFKEVSGKVVKEFKIPIPPLNEQKAIAHILSTLDDKIEVNNQINKTLENMAQAIFKQWFVDFEFPNEDGEPYKSSGGEMVESELGMIPKGWEVKKSSDIANINIGKTPPRKEKECFTLDPDDYKWISIKDLGNSGAYIFDSSEYLTKESIEKYNVKVVPDNTVVLSFKLTVGRVSITCGQMTTNEAIAHFNLSNKSKITTEYLYLYLKSFDYGKLGNTSSIANAVNSKIIKAMPIIVPDNKTIKTFSEVMESVFSKIKYTIKQSDKLIEIRDTLLPKLMSGEIRVPMDEEGDLS